MKVAAFSDVHGNIGAFEAAIKEMAGADRFLFLGDLAGYYPFVNKCAEAWPAGTIAVRGNHDAVLLECLATGKRPSAEYTSLYGSALERAMDVISDRARELIESFAIHAATDLDGCRIAMFHGAPWDPLEGRVYPDFQEWERFESVDADIILLGHTHYPMIRTVGKKLIVNPGSVGQARDRSGEACFAIVDTDQRTAVLHRVGYDWSQVSRDAQEHDPQRRYLWEVLSR